MSALPKVVARLGIVGFEVEGTPIGGFSLLQPALLLKRDTEVIVGRGVVGLDGDGLADELARGARVTLLELENTEKMQSARLFRLLRQDFRIDTLGFGVWSGGR